jgi:hypothetical protein
MAMAPLAAAGHPDRPDRYRTFAAARQRGAQCHSTLNSNLTVNIAGSKITGAGSVDFSMARSTFPRWACG